MYGDSMSRFRDYRRPFAVATTCATFLFLAAVAQAADVPKGPNSAEELPTVELLLTPAAAPVPALKYRLLPTALERIKGNAAVDYGRVAVLYENLSHDAAALAFLKDRLKPLSEMPLDKLSTEGVAKELQKFEPMFKELDRASRREQCDWQVPLEDGYETRLDEFQALRQPARLMALRARLQMAAGDLDGALSSFRTNYQLSKNVNNGRTIISSLIGVAVAAITRTQLETFIQQPSAPNLYWALTELPTPFIDMRAALETETLTPGYCFPEIATLRSHVVSRDVAQRLSDKILEKWIKSGITKSLPKNLEEARHLFTASAEANVAKNKQVLLNAGRARNEVDAMSPEQLAWAASYQNWNDYWDDQLKWAFLPAPERQIGLWRAEQRLIQFHQEHSDSPFELTDFIPAVRNALAAQDRTDRQIALLRVVEAIRLYTDAHPGQLPSSLDQIDAVPIPTDPMTGKPFDYRLDGNGAVLQTPPTPAEVPESKYQGRRYIISLRKG